MSGADKLDALLLLIIYSEGEIMQHKNLIILPAVLLIAACGGTYQVTPANPAQATPKSFASDEIACNQTNFFVSSSASGPQTVYMTDSYLACMKSKGWNFNKTSSKFSFIKPAN